LSSAACGDRTDGRSCNKYGRRGAPKYARRRFQTVEPSHPGGRQRSVTMPDMFTGSSKSQDPRRKASRTRFRTPSAVRRARCGKLAGSKWWRRVSEIPDGRRWDSSPKIRFAPDSTLQEEGFEPSVPRKRTTLFETAPARPPGNSLPRQRTGSLANRDRRFESLSLRQLVCRRVLDDARRRRRARRGRMPSDTLRSSRRRSCRS
jgi:hypothetical protein